MGLCKIDSWIWTFFSFVLHMMTWWLVLAMVPTVFDKTQARARKSIFCVKSYKNVAVNHLELIRDKLKILFGAENSGLKWYTFQKWDRFYMQTGSYSLRKTGSQNVFSGTLMRSMVPKCVLTTHFAKAVVSSLHAESISF